MKRVLTFIVIFISICAKGQNTGSSGNTEINIIQDQKVNELVDKHIKLNKDHKIIYGYRIQIFFDSGINSKARAFAVKSDFMAQHPNSEEVYVLFQEPNYKVRVGDFRTSLDAQGFLSTIKNEYPNAFVVADEINFPRLEDEQSN